MSSFSASSSSAHPNQGGAVGRKRKRSSADRRITDADRLAFDDASLHKYCDDINSHYSSIMGNILCDEFNACKHSKSRADWKAIHDFCKNIDHVQASSGVDCRLHVPFSCLISGKSQCGKTELLLSILSQWRYITDDHNGAYTKRVYWFYGSASEDQMSRVKDVYNSYREHEDDEWAARDGDDSGGHHDLQFIRVSTFKDDGIIKLMDSIKHAIVVFDDLMNEMVKSEHVTNFFTRECHHSKICMFYVWQNLYPQSKYARSISTNVQYKFVFQNAETRHQLKTLLVQMYPNKHRQVYKSIEEFFESEPPTKYPYVLFRTSPKEENRHCTIVGYAVNRNIEDVKNTIFSEPIRVIRV